MGNHLIGANPLPKPSGTVVKVPGIDVDAEATEVYYKYKTDVLLGIVHTTVEVAVEVCG